MREFLAGVFAAMRLAGAGVMAAVYRTGRGRRKPLQKAADPDEELTRLTGELAHEIKNPLSTIKINLKLAEEALEDVDLSDPGRVLWDQSRHKLASAARKISIIQKETDRLEQILEGFLKYIRRPDLQVATVDLNELVGDMVDFYSPQAYSHSLTVRQSLAAEPLVCRVDAAALKQVLLNLFINAQQAMDTGGELMIRTARHGRCAMVVVNDTGRGIAPERLVTLFQPYQSSRSSGMGLGLATAKKIVEAHNGSISVHSEPGKGTSFTIGLPLAEEDRAPQEEPA